MYPAAAKIIIRIILENMKAYLESLMHREMVGIRSRFSCIDHINTPWIILEQCSKFRSSLQMLAMDFQKGFDSGNREGICTALGMRSIPGKLIPIMIGDI